MKFILFTSLLFISTSVFAQNSNKLKVALDFGLSMSTDVSFDPSYNDGKSLYAPALGVNIYSQIVGIHGFTTGLNYFRLGDNYNYYTGRNYETTDVKVYVHTVKVPVFYTAFFDKGKKVNVFFKAGPSLDFILGESVINPEKALNSPKGFRENISQGTVGKRLSTSLNATLGLSFKNKEGEMKSYLEILYYGRARNIYEDTSGSTSSYDNASLKYGIFLSK